MTKRLQWDVVAFSKQGATLGPDGWIRSETLSVTLKCPRDHFLLANGEPHSLNSTHELSCGECPPIDGGPQMWPTQWKPEDAS
jgi:hypothetical protein